MRWVCGDQPDLENHFQEIAREVADRLRAESMLGPGTRFLDVGCGCGRIARVLTDEPILCYCGFDRNPEMISWCVQNITPYDGRFQFLFLDLRSPYTTLDGHAGSIEVESFRFPFADGAMDSVLLASVFTHLDLGATRHYLDEIRRVLSPKGTVLATALFSEGAPHDDGVNFFFDRDQFIGTVEDAGFGWRSLENRRPGSLQNWFALEKDC
jgi:SAM-dependent methyltransferase